jgi:hypothetical protein
MASKEKNTPKQERTPIMRAQQFGGEVASMTGKMLGYILMVAFLSLVLSAVTGGGSIWGLVINLILIVCFFMLEFMEGATRGEHDVTMSRMVESRLREKNVQPEKRELASCYGPQKAFIAFALATGVFFLLALAVALAAKPYTYALQDLPTWMNAYNGRDDVTSPLAFYRHVGSATVVDYIRIVVRACILPFVNLFPDVQESALLIDRLSPLFIILLPLSYPLGYLMGPHFYEKRMRENEEAKKATMKRIRRKNKKERQKRMEGIREKNLQEKREQKRRDNQLI